MTEAAAFTQLATGGPISTRAGVSITFSDGTVHRFTRDVVERISDGLTFAPVPYGEISSISTKAGGSSDSVKIKLDGASLIDGAAMQSPEVEALFVSLTDYKLPNARVDIDLIVLDPCNDTPVGNIRKFSGLVDSAVVDLSDIKAPYFELNVLSFRVRLQKPQARLYSDTDQQTLHAGDRSLRHMADSEFRNGEMVWNKENSGSGGSGGGRSPGDPIDPGDIIRRLF